MTLVLADRSHPLRARLEEAVQEVYRAEFDACVPRFPDRLMGLLGHDETPLAVTGLRFGNEGLFSIAYLEGDAEEVLSRALGRAVSLDRVVEFSSLAAPRPGAAMPLVAAAIRFCHDAGADFGMFTATARLRALLRRNKLLTVDLGPAQAERVADASVWGSYYLHDPRVLMVAADTLPTALIRAPRTEHNHEVLCHA